MGGETVVLLTAGTLTDRRDTDTEDWANPTETEMVTAWPPAPLPSSETSTADRDPVTSGFALYFDTWPAITPRNRIRVRGVDYKVVGEPAEWRWPSGETAGSVVEVRRTAG